MKKKRLAPDAIASRSTQQQTTGFSVARAAVIKGKAICENLVVHDEAGSLAIQELMHRLTMDFRTRADKLPALGTTLLQSGPPLDEAITLHLGAMRLANIRPASVERKSLVLRLLLLACGPVPIGSIRAQHMTQFWDVVKHWPRGKTVQYTQQGMTDAEILEEGRRLNGGDLSVSSKKPWHGHVQAFFNWLVDQRLIPSSPIGAFPFKDDITQSEAARPLNDREIATLFDESVVRGWAGDNPARWWLPIMGYYTGARVNELAQLQLADIEVIAGNHCISIRARREKGDGGAHQRVKNAASIRKIPIAQQLIDAGFLAYVDEMRGRSEKALFPNLRAGTKVGTNTLNGSPHAAPFGSEFSTHLQAKLCLAKGCGFHMLRHTFTTTLAQKGVSNPTIGALIGHAPPKTNLGIYTHTAPDALNESSLAAQAEALRVHLPTIKHPHYTPGQFDEFLRKISWKEEARKRRPRRKINSEARA